jgi:hypothetical protein
VTILAQGTSRCFAFCLQDYVSHGVTLLLSPGNLAPGRRAGQSSDLQRHAGPKSSSSTREREDRSGNEDTDGSESEDADDSSNSDEDMGAVSSNGGLGRDGCLSPLSELASKGLLEGMDGAWQAPRSNGEFWQFRFPLLLSSVSPADADAFALLCRRSPRKGPSRRRRKSAGQEQISGREGPAAKPGDTSWSGSAGEMLSHWLLGSGGRVG